MEFIMFNLSSQDREALIGFLQDLVHTPSTSTQEGEVAQRLAEEMRRVGFAEVTTDRIGNVIGRIGPGRGRKLLYNGHLDTVDVTDPCLWHRDPYGAEIEEGVLYGLGACDMKGALAAMVYGVKALVDADVELGGDLYVIGVVQEEPCEGLAMRVLVEEEGLRPDFVVLGEATNLQISRGQRGRIELKVTARGRSCHSSAPERGENAIYAAARLAEIQSVIAREGVKAEVEVTEYCATSYAGYQCQGKEYYPAWVMAEDHPLVQAVARAVKQTLGYKPRLGKWDFSTDGVYTMGVTGIPTVGFGPGEERYLHTVDDQIRLADVVKAARVYAQLAVEVLGAR
jgi:acetylornithine deacetylase/succinyl-diaminopimelate desuccinylase-like protein